MTYPPLMVTSATARRNIPYKPNAVTPDQARRLRLSATGVTAPGPSTNDAGHASIVGNGVIFAGGVLFACAYSVDLTVAWTMAVTAFAIMIIGGPGSVLGAVVVGMVFGFTQAIVSIFASPTIAAFSHLGAMLVILLFRPSGLFAR